MQTGAAAQEGQKQSASNPQMTAQAKEPQQPVRQVSDRPRLRRAAQPSTKYQKQKNPTQGKGRI